VRIIETSVSPQVSRPCCGPLSGAFFRVSASFPDRGRCPGFPATSRQECRLDQLVAVVLRRRSSFLGVMLRFTIAVFRLPWPFVHLVHEGIRAALLAVMSVFEASGRMENQAAVSRRADRVGFTVKESPSGSTSLPSTPGAASVRMPASATT